MITKKKECQFDILFFVSLRPNFFKMRNYLKILLLLIVLACSTSIVVTASPISKNKLIDYAKEAYRQKVIVGCDVMSTTEPKDFFFIGDEQKPLLLVMNFPQGFVMLSADDAEQPVLAYSSTSNFYLNEVAPATLLFVEQYQKEISYIREAGLLATDEVSAQWKALKTGTIAHSKSVVVSPLLTATWNQTRYYNQYSPIDHDSPIGYDSKTPNGCVAVAMSMIMYYYRYPLQGSGTHTNHSSYGNFTVNFGQQHYNYNAMTDELGFYNNEVAKLIFHAATSVDMNYSPQGSGAQSYDVPSAMATYFGYSSNAYFQNKNNVSSGTTWRNMLKDELDAGRPLYYSGYSDEGGHAFVCDGYDSDNLFHFNFGWGGTGNGYYSTSSSSSNPVNGYSNWQGAIFNLYPANDYPYYCNEQVITAVSGTLEDGSNALPYQNNTKCTYVIAPQNAEDISVHIQQFDTEADHDSLSFWDGDPQNGNLLLSLSGGMPSTTNYTFQVDSLYITFETDAQGTGEGWRFDYEASPDIMPCHSGVFTEPSGFLSDGSDDNSYRANANCVWKIRVSGATYIGLSFSELDISPEDGLYVYDASTTPNELLTVYTGNTIPTDDLYYTDKLVLKFVTDNDLNGQGFHLAWFTDYSYGIQDAQNADLVVYPNPTNALVNVKVGDQFTNPTIQIFDVTGRQVRMVSVVDDDVITLDVKDLTAGVYMLTCTENGKSIKKKLIISHK